MSVIDGPGGGLVPLVIDTEWLSLAPGHVHLSLRVQECNWLQGVEGGFDATHLTFLHGGDTALLHAACVERDGRAVAITSAGLGILA